MTDRKYRVSILLIIVVLVMTMTFLFVRALDSVGETYKNLAAQSILETKKIYLQDTVNNLVRRIEQENLREAERAGTRMDDLERMLRQLYVRDAEHYPQESAAQLEAATRSALDALLIREDGTLTYYGQEETVTDPQEFAAGAAVLKEIPQGKTRTLLRLSLEKQKELVQDTLYREIHNARYSQNGYVWVNEVIDYGGGDEYAIRRIHPNLKDTEGIYLSTSMTDIRGNTPYLTELEGVRDHGEIFFTYFFQKKDSEEISEKITYARLYPEYNWILAMGIHLDDVDNYVDNMATVSDRTARFMVIQVAGLGVVLLLLSLLMVWYITHKEQKMSRIQLDRETRLDALTGALNRRAADQDLAYLWKEFRQDGQDPALIMFDADDFKQINDAYGHQMGDEVLRGLVNTILKNVRSTDRLYRWGGEEFLLICPGLRPDRVEQFTEKLLLEIRQQTYVCREVCLGITVSAGVAYFSSADSNETDAIHRADGALYRAKGAGKNRVVLDLPEGYKGIGEED